MTHKLKVVEKLKERIKIGQPLRYLDIGANRAQFYKEVKEAFNDVQACLIEPNQHCKNLKHLNVEYHYCGISNKNGQMELILPRTKLTSKAGTFYKDINLVAMNKHDLVKINVPVYKLDTMFPDRVFDLIKIDVQGSELDVLEGGEQTIKRSRYVIVECSLKEFNIGAPLADKIVNKLQSMGFYIEDILDEYYLDKNPIPAQIDLLFSNLITNHKIDKYKDLLGIESNS